MRIFSASGGRCVISAKCRNPQQCGDMILSYFKTSAKL
jgi:hypothetical protein